VRGLGPSAVGPSTRFGIFLILAIRRSAGLGWRGRLQIAKEVLGKKQFMNALGHRHIPEHHVALEGTFVNPRVIFRWWFRNPGMEINLVSEVLKQEIGHHC